MYLLGHGKEMYYNGLKMKILTRNSQVDGLTAGLLISFIFKFFYMLKM